MAPDGNSTPLTEMMRTVVNRSKDDAGRAIEGLATIADGLDMQETAAKLRETSANLASDTFNIIIIGRFKNGKSTLLNAMLGGTTQPVELYGNPGPQPVDSLPATPTLTCVKYADEPYVKAWLQGGGSEDWTFRRYLSESVLDADEEENARKFDKIDGFEMGYPAQLLQSGVMVYDSPGTDEHIRRTTITKNACQRCDAAIVVYRADVLMGRNEMLDATDLVADGTKVFTVVNMWDGRKSDDRFRRFVWNRYVHEHLGGEKWDGQELTARDIYPVDARAAGNARTDGDSAGVEAAGLAAFERRLADFLARDRHQSHLRKFCVRAESLASAIDQHIAQRRMAIRADQSKLREAYDEIVPQLTEIRRRPTRLTGIIRRHRAAAIGALSSSFLVLTARIRDELPHHLQEAKLRTGGVKGVIQQKKLAAEVGKVISDFISARLTEWETTEAKVALEPILTQLTKDITEEIAEIGRQYDGINFELTGWEVQTRSGSIVSPTERILSIVGHLFFGNIAGVVAGGAGGWRGAVGSAAGTFGAGFVLAMIGATTLGTLVIPALAAGLVIGFLAGGIGLDDRAKKKILAEVDPKLSQLPEEMAPQLEHALMQAFDALEAAVAEEIGALITEEERNITEIVSLNQSDQADRDRMLVSLEEASASIANHRRELGKVL